MQDILGLANDSYVACERLNGLRTRYDMRSPSNGRTIRDGSSRCLLSRTPLAGAAAQVREMVARWLKSGAEKAFVELIRGI